MLERMEVIDFQAHRKFVVELDPVVTTLVGPNDAGKSSLLRALRWLCLNKPAGGRFLRHGAKLCVASLRVDGHTIRRKKGASRNTYSLDGKLFKSFRDGVPDAVSALLNVGDANFQRQIDAPFWFSESAGQVSKRLNEVVDLSVMDDCLARLAAELRAAKAEKEVRDADLKASRAANRRLASVPEMHRQLAALEGMAAALADGRRELSEVTRLVGEAGDASRRGGRVVPDFSKVGALADRAAESSRSLAGLADLVAEADSQAEVLRRWDTEVETLSTRWKSLTGKRCPLCGSSTGATK